MNPNTEPKKEGPGAFIGSVIIVIILIVLAVYFIHDQFAKQKAIELQNQKIEQQNAANAAILNAIEQQLNTPEPDLTGSLNSSSQSNSTK